MTKAEQFALMGATGKFLRYSVLKRRTLRRLQEAINNRGNVDTTLLARRFQYFHDEANAAAPAMNDPATAYRDFG
ncbi:hypothetical protein [Novosphingobium sp. 9]|uniref:hypothetical protein n=1 Tax=Novosphingobium sp. 9 TaxID=2025349 RepID=UPI0021B6E300|nr:hypothetical protein [Novosphingobium sp. 9]